MSIPIFIALGTGFASYLIIRAKAPAMDKFKRGLEFNVAIFSHRGGSLEFVENTLPGFRYSADKLKASVLELDVHLTKDGQVVIFHDDSLKRMTMIDKKLSDFNYADLPPLMIPSNLRGFDHVINDPDSTRIPLLRELFDIYPSYPMQIDVKNGSEELILKVGEMIQDFKREKTTVWGTFRRTPNNLCFKHFPEIPLFFSFYRAMLAKTMWHFGLFHTFVLRESCLIIPPIWPVMNKDWIKDLRNRNVDVVLFTLNSPERWEIAKNIGASGICTDVPTKLNSWLQDHHLL